MTHIRRYQLILIALICLMAGYALGFSVGVSETLPPENPVQKIRACEFEDSDNCYWDAQSRGNGAGDSFVVIDGVYFYSK